MGDGSLKAIDDVRTHDIVLADDPADGLPPGPHRVLGQIRNSTQTLYCISWDVNGDAAPDACVQTTSEHPFWTVDNGWRPACALKSGMALRDKDGHSLRVCSVVKTEGPAKTFNIDVEGPNTFFVAANGSTVLLHNLEGELYLYGSPPPSGIVGTYLDSNGLEKHNQAHHLFHDQWLTVHYP